MTHVYFYMYRLVNGDSGGAGDLASCLEGLVSTWLQLSYGEPGLSREDSAGEGEVGNTSNSGRRLHLQLKDIK